MVSARSIWSQAAAKFSPIGPTSGPRAMQYCRSRPASGWSGWVPERAWMRSWVLRAWLMAPVSDEADQALGEDRGLGAGGQPDGQPPGGEVVDGAALGVGGGDAVVDEPLVQGQVRERAVLGQPVGAGWPWAVTPLSVLRMCLAGQSAASRSSCPPPGSCSRLRSPGGWDAAATASGPVRPSSAAQLWMCGQSRWPSRTSLVGGGVGQDHRGDGAVAVQGPAGEPGHFPSVPAGCVPGGVRGLVAGHGGVVDGQGHGSASRSGSGSRWRSWPGCRAWVREAAAAGYRSVIQSLAATTIT